MKKTFSILLFLVFFLSTFAQTSTIDSLKVELAKTKIDTVKVNLNLLLSSNYSEFDLKMATKYGNDALQYSLKSQNYKLADIYTNLGVCELNNGKDIEARAYFEKALGELAIKENKTLRGLIYGNYSTSYERSNDFEKQLEYSLKAIDLNKENDVELCFLYYNHSLIYESAGFHDEGLHYLKLAKDISERSNEFRIEAYSVQLLAYYAINDKEYELAKKYLIRGKEICEQMSSAEICHHMYMASGMLLTEIDNFEGAEASLLKAKEFALQRKIKYDIIASEILLGNLEFKRDNYKKSTQIFNSINIDSFDIETIVYANIFYKNRSLAEGKIGNYRKSNQLLNQYVAFGDSIRLSKNRTLLAQADRKYKSEKKDKELLVQKLALQKQENEIQKKNNQMTLLYGISLFLLVASLLTWLIYQQKNKRKSQEIVALKREHQISTLESLMQGEEKERLRIAKELHDGVNGDLSAIKLKLSSLLEMNNKVIKEAVSMIDDSCRQVRAISHNLVPPTLDNFNLIEAAEDYCFNLNEMHTQEIVFQHLGDSFSVSKSSEINIFRIIQELVSNSIKHAEADEINVQISCHENQLSLSIEDNGIGFDPKTVKSKGIGLNNIQSRVNYLQAIMDVLSNEDGTSYTIEMDINKLNDNN
ncbi:tetratricopeptide repeat-containing sensor histidine kinase [Psychroserpens ponticola]|uniref:histidine kinase n=1 Tax=Psychroserpens ponticola TaxID=2932268 RepID=A0ABY7S0J7_9FLAO|nr:sensor histidine kinase [Psychroserpens ponticola]WCO02451.1 sensor histidine kinase [Psychroserpens ponticola]